MNLRAIMSTPVLTTTTKEPASDALARMRDAGVRHAVVVSGSSVVGVVSDRDLGGPRGGTLRAHHTVGELMQADVLVAAPEMRVPEAVMVLRQNRIGCIPVVQAGKLVGIVTRGDVLEALARHRRRGRSRSAPRDLELPSAPCGVSPNRDKRP